MTTTSLFRILRTFMLVALLVGLPLAGSLAAQGKIDASRLLTKEEAGEILGTTILVVKTGGDGVGYSSATYVTSDGSTIVVLVQPSRDAAAAQAVFDKNKGTSKSTSGVDPEPVAGLGDRAFWAGGRANTLAVVKGRYWLSVAMFLIDSPKEPARKLAAKVLERLS
ncbi:MAG TPA: hypothetical protein P5119_05395 [Candidatus Aminicenantes bacterium]|nr:hypothetical protein [Candidatus Aminicenantes bacterium]HRY64758.1 hypothetical protein [Candidatus Aminicenantes bacterium]HRZ71671.1 hypothetical protein [Candidatus Aminicenantes bacterium]